MRSLFQSWLAHDTRKRPQLRYEADLRRMSPHLVDTFVLLDKDAETDRWMDLARNPSMWRAVFSDYLRLFFSRTTANGIAGRGGMFVLSQAHCRALLADDVPSAVATAQGRALLDIGAGDGGVTQNLAPQFSTVHVTEDSASMRWRLGRRGYKVLPIDAAWEPEAYDVVSCLNVLDRADKPMSLLHAIRAALKPNGVLLLALVLPWCPFVENGSAQKPPTEHLPMAGGECCKGATFEASLERLVANVLEPAGFELLRWSKLPYLSEGSTTHEYYKLDDAVVVLRRRS